MKITDTITMIPIAQIVESPFNPRRTFGDKGLQELATDIKLHGILSPLLVRPRLVDPLATADKMFDGNELIFGHRRFRAAKLANLVEVPCMVRGMTDDQARRAQISENLAREDVHPIEEAEGLQALIDAGDSADQLAAQFGKSRSYVYGRLKLLAACPKVRDACLRGEIGSDTALLIARLRTVKLQEKALSYIQGKNWDLKDGGVKSYRQIRDLLAERFTLDLKKPMFDPTDALLVAAAGPCGSCMKRVGNAPEFEDLANDRPTYWSQVKKGNPDVCTDPDCYDAKKKAHLRNAAAAFESAGKTVVEGNKARAAIGADGKVKGAYIALKDVKSLLKGAPKSSPVATVLIQDPRTGNVVEAVARDAIKTAGIKVSEPKPSHHARTQEDWARERKERDLRAQAENEARHATLKRVHDTAALAPRSHADMEMIVEYALEMVDTDDEELIAGLWGYSDRHGLRSAIKTMTGAQLAMVLLDCAMTYKLQSYGYGDDEDRPPYLDRAAALYPADGTPTPSTAARAAKGAKGKAEKKAKPARSAGAGVDLVGDPIVANQSDDAGSAGEEAKDEPADAGVERDPNTSDMFHGEPA